MAKVVLGITGGIAAYKGASICSGLTRCNDEVRVVTTPAAEKMIQAHTLSALSHGIVYNDKYWMENTGRIDHIELAEWLDILLIAPATANTIGKIANGIANNLLCALAMATSPEKTRAISPAMNTIMWESAPVRRNVALLKEDKWAVIPPAEGKMACGTTGPGVLPKTRTIINQVKNVFDLSLEALRV